MVARSSRLAALSLLFVGCSSTSPSTPPADAGGAPDAGAGAVVRGGRYCEILVANVTGTDVNAKVYSTVGRNDCPDDAWSAIDADALKTSLGASMVQLNGPRYWMIDSAAGSTLQDPTVVTFGGIEMRQAGAITVPVASAATLRQPYTQHTIQRNSAFAWEAGQPVFELVVPDGHVYTMQSYSVQKVPTLTQAALPTLGASLTLPAGWSYRTRTLEARLEAVATTGTATVVQDDDENTYLQTQ